MSRNDENLSDHRLTDYAVGELNEAEMADMAARLAADPDARREVEEIHAVARALTAALSAEQVGGLSDAQRAKIHESVAQPKPVSWLRRRVPFAVSAAALLLVGFGTYAVLISAARRADFSIDAGRGQGSERADRIVTHPMAAAGVGSPRAQGPAPSHQNYPGASGTPASPPGMYPGVGYPGMTYPGMDYSVTPSPGIGAGGRGGYPGMLGSAMPAMGGYPGMPGMPGMQPAGVMPGGMGYSETSSTEAYDGVTDSKFLRVADQPLSTFSIDVDTASYSNVRRFLTSGTLPPKDAVRIEELVNYFPYRYAPPRDGDAAPFAAHIEVAGCPWNQDHRLVRIGLKGREIARDKRPPSNLVFLIDVSGSMQPQIKLPLVQLGMRMLVRELNENDRVAMVVYAGSTGLVLPATTGDQKGTLLGAIDALGAGGSTNGSGGIELAYQVAAENFRKGGVNRVLLCTDGDFNVGVTDPEALTKLIQEKATTGVYLSVLGFGMGNLKDATMEKLADKGNGNYAYVDTLAEARKVLVEQMSGTLVTIAKDVKAQVEFNPAKVSSYRLVGYENRLLAKEDFNDDKKDAGEIGAGHTVTALYEVVPAGADDRAPGVDPLKYQKSAAAAPRPADDASGEMLTVKLRYKEPDGTTSKLLGFPVTDAGAAYGKATEDFKFAASVAAFGMILRDSPHKGAATFSSVIELAEEGLGRDEGGYRAEFISLVQKAKSLAGGK